MEHAELGPLPGSTGAWPWGLAHARASERDREGGRSWKIQFLSEKRDALCVSLGTFRRAFGMLKRCIW